jgi:hypothetical protein
VDTVNPKVAGLATLVALAFVVGPAVAHAQAQSLVANIPFKFVAAGKPHDAGAYGLRLNTNRETVELVPPKGPGEVMLVVTRLAAPDRPTPEGRLVFDKVRDTNTLSEIWVPGEDGFLVYATKETHGHQAIPLGKKAR